MRGAQEKGSSSVSSYEDLNKEYHHETPAEPTTHEEHEELVGTICCPNCSHKFEPTPEVLVDFFKRFVSKFGGVKFEPSDEQLINHLEEKVNRFGDKKPNPLMDEFIATIEGDKDICYTVPDRLPGVTKDGTSKHFFHKSSKAYKTGSRKRRKIQSTEQVQVSETRWHKTGKTKQIISNGIPRGCKKILVLYTNFGKSRKPAKTNWIMHQYHLGGLQDENDGELVVSKIFYQTHPRQPSTEGKKCDGPYEFFQSHNNSEVPSEQSLQPEAREPISYMQMPPCLNIHGSLAPQVLSMPALNLNPPKLLPQDSNFPALINLNEPTVLYSPLVIGPPMHQAQAILPNDYQENMAATSTYQQQQYHGDATTSLEEMMTSCAEADPKEGTSNNAPSNSNVDWGFLNWQTNNTNE